MTSPPPSSVDPKPPRSRLRRLAWGCVRLLRTALTLLILTVAVLGLFLNKVGLPEFIKERVIAQARAKGWEVQFSRLRLRWYRGVVADDLQIKGTNHFAGPQLFVEEAECPLNPSALKNLDFRMNSLRLRGGRLIWPLVVSNQVNRAFVLNNINGQLLFREDGEWELRSWQAEFHRIKLELAGSLANALMLRQWKTPSRAEKVPAQSALRQIEMLLSELKLAGGSELRINFHGDGNDLSGLSANFYFSVPTLDSPWGAASKLALFGQLIPPPQTNDSPSAAFKLVADSPSVSWGKAQSIRLDLDLKPLFRERSAAADAGRTVGPSPGLVLPTNANLTLHLTGLNTRWGQAEDLSLTASGSASATNTALAQTAWTVSAQRVRSEWVQATNVQLKASVVHSLSNRVPALVVGEMRLDQAQTRWGRAQSASLRARVPLPAPGQFHLFDTNLAWPERFENLSMETTALLTNVHSEKLDFEKLSLALAGRSPQWRLESSGSIAQGEFKLDGQLDTSSRELFCSASSSVAPRWISALLSTNVQKWLASCNFQTPPTVQAQGRVVLPEWTNRQPDWVREVLPTMRLAGKVEMGAGAYRGISFDSAQSPFSLTNLLWRMPALRITRPEGAVEADYTSNPSTRDFHCRIHSQIDPQLAKTFLQAEAARQAFEFFQFSTPPDVEAEVWGRWGDLERLGGVARVGMTNFTFRGEPVKDCQTRLEYTNKVLRFSESQLQRDRGERGAATGITLDLGEQKLYFTNGFSTLDPYVTARAVGKSALDAIAPYQFDTPPTARLNGALDLNGKRHEEDLHFDISGGRFHWQNLRLQKLIGRVDWVGQTLTLTNVLGAFQTGRLSGSAHFDFTPARGADFSCHTLLDGASLREVAAPLSGHTNKLEGLLSGELVVTQANVGNLKSWQGHGQLSLHDGLIWDIPMFGIFSPVLNGFLPGLGYSRANEAAATFLLTNGVFASKDLEIHATMMRMRFKGAVGLNQRVDARVEAELLRDLPAIGFVISKVFWPVTKIFEYRVTGTLTDPKAEPLYVLPKMLLMPLHPFRTLKGLFLEEPKDNEEKKPAP